MPETALLAAFAWLLLAAASHRFRREADVHASSEVRLLRIAAVPLLLLALFHCGTDIDGERWVRVLGAASLAAITVVLALSAWPHALFAPVRIAMRAIRTCASETERARAPARLGASVADRRSPTIE